MPHLRTSDGLAIAYDNDGDGTAVILVHGLGASRARWDGTRAALLTAGYRVVRYDLRGFGDSDLPAEEYPFAELVDDFSAIVRAVGLEGTPFHLVGHSLGGMIAQRYVLDQPEQVLSLTLCSTTSHVGKRATAFSHALVQFSRHGFDAVARDPEIRATVERILEDAFDSPPPIEFFRKGLEEPNQAQALAWAATMSFSVKDELRAVRCPALVLHGTADRVIPLITGRAIHRLLPEGARWVEIEGADHQVPARATKAFNNELLAFLGRAESARAEAMP